MAAPQGFPTPIFSPGALGYLYGSSLRAPRTGADGWGRGRPRPIGTERGGAWDPQGGCRGRRQASPQPLDTRTRARARACSGPSLGGEGGRSWQPNAAALGSGAHSFQTSLAPNSSSVLGKRWPCALTSELSLGSPLSSDLWGTQEQGRSRNQKERDLERDTWQ